MDMAFKMHQPTELEPIYVEEIQLNEKNLNLICHRYIFTEPLISMWIPTQLNVAICHINRG